MPFLTILAAIYKLIITQFQFGKKIRPQAFLESYHLLSEHGPVRSMIIRALFHMHTMTTPLQITRYIMSETQLTLRKAMPEATSSNPAASVQANSESSEQNTDSFSDETLRRRLDHMRDLADGLDQFDMVPRKLSRSYIDGKFPEAKFRLLLCMMSHSSDCSEFRITRTYLESRFSHRTIVKYLKELELEGYIKPEALKCPTGGMMKIYHVRSLRHWRIYQNDDRSLSRGSLSRGSLSRGLKESKEKESNKKKTNSSSSKDSEKKSKTNDDDKIDREKISHNDDVPEVRERLSHCFENEKGPWKSIEASIRTHLSEPDHRRRWIDWVEDQVVIKRNGQKYTGKFGVITVRTLIQNWKVEHAHLLLEEMRIKEPKG